MNLADIIIVVGIVITCFVVLIGILAIVLSVISALIGNDNGWGMF